MDDNDNVPQRAPHQVGEQPLLNPNPPPYHLAEQLSDFSRQSIASSFSRHLPSFDPGRIRIPNPLPSPFPPDDSFDQYLQEESQELRRFNQDYLPDLDDYPSFPGSSPYSHSPSRSNIRSLNLFHSSPTRGEKFSELPLFISQQKRGPGRPRKDGQSPIPRKSGNRPRGMGRRGRPASYQSLTFRQAFTAPVMSTSISSLQSDLLDAGTGSNSNLGSSSSQSSFPGDLAGVDVSVSMLSESSGMMVGASGAGLETEIDDTPMHICAFCGCGEKSLLGQGRLIKFDPTQGYDVFSNTLQRPELVSDSDTDREKNSKQHLTWRRMRGPPKGCRERSRSPRQSSFGLEDEANPYHVIDELTLVGFTEDVELQQVYEPTGHLWAHQCCAIWSVCLGVIRSEDGNSLVNVDKAVFTGLTHKCGYCNRFGASLQCCVSECGLYFHYPCAAAGGSYQDYTTLSLWCPQHIQQAETTPSGVCVQCGSVGNVAEQLFCTSCGMHYHGTCLCPAVEVKAIVRAGWQCPNCKICQTCRHPGEDSKMLVCDTCDKGYHTFCLKPAMTTIPKNGWKCKNCRVCSDCGARTPGNGPSSRWHLNYSVCDSCYQQRNKGLCCPLCGKAYRHFHNKTMVPCNKCKKFVHSECDLTIDATILQKMRDNRPTDYICSVCIEQEQEQQMELGPFPLPLPEEESLETFPPIKDTDSLIIKEDSFLSESVLTASSQESLYDEDSSMDFDFNMIDQGLSPAHPPTYPTPTAPTPQGGKGHGGKGKLIDRGKLSAAGKKKLNSGRQRGRPFSEKRRNRDPIQYGEKRRGPKVKIKLGGGTPTSQIISTGSCKDDKSEDSGDDHPSTITLCNSKDMFSLDQDVCKSCGAFGAEDDGKLISCTQCGQCYHPYCASVKVTKVILLKGWRCLDCTVCEGCGKPDDESRLLLCDDCDISYHTYCLKPPLEHVPKGNWKCKWCVSCLNCGSTSPGFGCNWKNNYTQCGPCASKVICPCCRRSYQQEDLIIQCVQCDRWLHALCDGLKNEDEAELAADYGYHCLFCRPKTGHDGPLPPPPPPPPPEPKEIKPPSPPLILKEPDLPKKFLVDGVYLFTSGMQQLENLALHMPRKPIQRRRRIDAATQIQHPNVARLLSMPSQEGDDGFDKDTDDLEGNDQGSLMSPPILPPGQEPGPLPGQPEAPPPPIEYNEDGTVKKVRKKRQVRRQIGVGGFVARQKHRMTSYKRQVSQEQDQPPMAMGEDGQLIPGLEGGFKRQRKPRKPKKSQLEESFPPYLQEAFFGREVLDIVKENKETLLDTEQDQEKFRVMSPCPLMLGGPSISLPSSQGSRPQQETSSLASTEHSDDIQNLDEGDLKDILPDIQPDEDILNILDQDQDLDMGDSLGNNNKSASNTLDNLLDPDLDEKSLDVDQILSEGLIQIDSKEVENLLGDSLQSNTRPGHPGGLPGMSLQIPKHLGEVGPLPELNPSAIPGAMSKLTGMGQSLSNVGPRIPGMGMRSPLHSPNPMMGGDPMSRMMGPGPSLPGMSPDSGFPPGGLPPPPYGPQGFPGNFNPQQMAGPYGGDPSLWGLDEDVTGSSRRNILKWEADEKLGENATISSILYVNTNYPTLIQEYPEWPERAKQIAKLWRKLSHDEKAPYLAQARKNRTSSRVQKAQRQVTQELKRRQEAQMRHDSEVMPPPPAPPPLHSPGQSMGMELAMSPRSDFNSPLSPNRLGLDGQSPLQSPLHSPGTINLPPIWPDEANKPVSVPGNMDAQQPATGLQRQLSNPDPYAFMPPSPRLDGMGATRPLSHPPRLPPPSYSQGALQRQGSAESDPFGRLIRPPTSAGPRMTPPSPDPYAFQPSTPRMLSTEDLNRATEGSKSSLPPDLAGVQASLPDMSVGNDAFAQSAATPRTSQASDPFAVPATENASDPFSQPPTPSAANDPYGKAPMTPRLISDSYAHPPGTPRSAPPGEHFIQPPAEGFMHAQSPRHDPYAQQPMTPRSVVGLGSPLHSPNSRVPGPLRHPEPSQAQFRHHLARSQSLPDPYSSQPGTPHPMMGSPMSRAISVGGPEPGMPQYRRPGPFPETSVSPDGMVVESSMAGGVNPQHQQLRERLAQQTKQRQIRKQIEDREKMMHMAPPPGGWPHPDGASPRHPGMARMPGFPPERGPRPPFVDPATGQPIPRDQWPMGQRMVRPPHPGQFPPDSEGFHPRIPGQYTEGMRPGFPPTMRMARPPGPPGPMQMSFRHPDGSQPQDPMAERRAHFLMMKQKAQEVAAQGQIPGSMGTAQIPPAAPGEPFPQFPPEIPEPSDLPLPGPATDSASGEDDIFPPASNLKATIPENAAEGGIQLPDIEPKDSKPSQSSEDDKHESMDDDLLNDDGTFDILRFTDPELDKILGEEEMNLLDDFMDEHKAKEDTKDDDLTKPEVKPEEEEKKPESEDKTEVKADDDKTESKDFQSKFLEFSQKRQDSTEKSKADTPKPTEKSKGPVGVSHIAALLQGTKPLESKFDKAEAEKQEIQNLAGTVEALRKDMEARRQEAVKQDMMGLPSPLGQRPHFGPGMASPLHHVTSPHQSPSIGIPSQNAEVGGLQSPKILPSPRSGQPSPRTPGMQSPFGPMLGPVLSPMNHQMNQDQQLSPFHQSSAQPPFSPPVSSNPLSPFPPSTSGPHSPFPQLGPNLSQSQFVPPFGSPSQSVSQPISMGPTFPMQHSSRATITPTNQYTQGTYGQPPYMPPRGGTLTPSPNSILYGQSAAAQHAIRQPGPGMRSPFSSFPGLDPLDPKAIISQAPGSSHQPMMSPTLDSRPQHMIQKIQQGLMEMGKGPTTPDGQPFFRPERPQQQLISQGLRPMMHMRPGSPRFNAAGQRLPPPGMRMMGPRHGTPGSPGFQGPSTMGMGPRPRSTPPGFTGPPLRPGMFPSASQQQTLLDELVEEEKKEQKRQAEQQAIARREIPNPEEMMGVGPRPTLGPGIPGVGPRMEQRMPTPDQVTPPLDMMAQQFQQFPVRPPGMQSPRTPSPFGGQSPGIQQSPINPLSMMAPQPPATPPSDMPLDDQQRLPYEDWLIKQGHFLEMQVKMFEQSTQKQKRAKRSIQARQRQARKVGNELNPADIIELERISTEQAGLQKQLDHFRKQFRNHQSLVQDYRDKQREQFGRNWQPILPPGPVMNPGQMSPGGRMTAPNRMPTPSRFQGPRAPQGGPRGPRGPGSNSVRMSPSARQEYETYMQSRLRMANPALANPNIPPIPKPAGAMTVIADNNPFSDSFQERENMEKMKQDIPAAPITEMMRPPFDGPQHPPPPPPPYPDTGPMFPRIPGNEMGDPRFPGFNQMPQGFGIPPSTLPLEMGSKDKPKKRRKKKKNDELESAQSQPLPPSLPNQAALLGQMGSKPGHTPPISKAELPMKPHSETERRILEILSINVALAQQKSSASNNPETTSTITTIAQSTASTSVTPSSQFEESKPTSLPSKTTTPPSSTEVTQSPFGQMPGASTGMTPNPNQIRAPGIPTSHPAFRPSVPSSLAGTMPGGPHGPRGPVKPNIPGTTRFPSPFGYSSEAGPPHHSAATQETPSTTNTTPTSSDPTSTVSTTLHLSTSVSSPATSTSKSTENAPVPVQPEVSSAKPSELSHTEETANTIDTDPSSESPQQAVKPLLDASESATNDPTEKSEPAAPASPASDPQAKKFECTDGIHCGTDDEDESAEPNTTEPDLKPVQESAVPNQDEVSKKAIDEKKGEDLGHSEERNEASTSDTATVSNDEKENLDSADQSIEMSETVVTGTLQNVTLCSSEELPLPQPCIISTPNAAVSKGEVVNVTSSSAQITVQTVQDTSTTTTIIENKEQVHSPSPSPDKELQAASSSTPTENTDENKIESDQSSVVVKIEPLEEATPQSCLAKLPEETTAPEASPTIKTNSDNEMSTVKTESSEKPSCANLQKLEKDKQLESPGTSLPFSSKSATQISESSSALTTAAISAQSTVSSTLNSSTNSMIPATSTTEAILSTPTLSSQPSTVPSSCPSNIAVSHPFGIPQGHPPPPPYPHSSGYPGIPTSHPSTLMTSAPMMPPRPGVPTSSPQMNPLMTSGYIRQGLRPGMEAALGPRVNPRMFPGGSEPRMMRMRMDPRMFRNPDPSQFRHGFDPRFMRPGMMPPGMDPRQFRPGMGQPGFDPSMLRPGMDVRMMMRPQGQESDQAPPRTERYHLRNPMDPQQMQFRHPGMDPNMIRHMLQSQQTEQQMPMNRPPQRSMMSLDSPTGHLQHPVSSSELSTSIAQSMSGQIRQPFPTPRQSGPHQLPQSTLPSNMSDHHRQMLAQQDAGMHKHLSSAPHHYSGAHRPSLSHAGPPMPHCTIPSSLTGPHSVMSFQHRPPAPSQMSPSSLGPHQTMLPHAIPSSFSNLPLLQTSQAVSNLEHFVSSASMPSAISSQTPSSTTSTPSPHLTSPASSTSPAMLNIKQEPGIDMRLSEIGDELEGEQRPSQNVLLKQLLATSSGRGLSQTSRSETPNSQCTDDALPELTPEQQRQLEMIEEMPLCKEAEVSLEEWDKKTPEEQEALMEENQEHLVLISETRKQEYEDKRRKYEEIRKAKRKVGQPNEPKQKRRKRIDGGMEPQQPGLIKRRRKSKLNKDMKPPGPEAEMEALYETFLFQLRSMPPVPLQEPSLEVNHSIVPVKGASTNKDILLRGTYGRGLIETDNDFYGHFILSQMSPRSLRTLPGLEKSSRRRFLGITESNRPFEVTDQQRYQLVPDKQPGLLSHQLLSGLNKELQLPPLPRIDSRLGQIKSESPDTVIYSSSPELGFGEQESGNDFPALRPIEPAACSNDGKISPFVPLIHPVPIKSEPGIKSNETNAEVKMETDGQIDSNDSTGALVPIVSKGDEMITTKLPITSGLVSPFTDPNSDQQVSVTLTLSASAAEDIGGVIAGIADLLQIAIPPTYEIRRTPSPESYKVQMTHKEQALNIHSLVRAKPKFCRHCDVVVISSGIIKKKADLAVLTKEEQESEGDEVTFCSMNCYMQFSITHQSNNTMEAKESGNIVEHKSVESTPTTSPRNVLSALSITTTPPSGTISASHTQPSTPTTPLSTPTALLPKESPSPNTLSPQIKFKAEEKVGRRLKRMSSVSSEPPKPVVKKWRDIKWKYWDIEISESLIKVKKHSKTEINELWCKLELSYKPHPMPEDTRDCSFCGLFGDCKPNGPSRLLNSDVDKWAHLNCSLWSSEVYETLNGALMCVDIAYKRGLTVECQKCKKVGATLSCFKVRCTNSFHLPCAQEAGCMFFQDKTILCASHVPKGPVENELTSLVVSRRVYINRDEDRQIASMIHQEEGNHILRIGTLTLHCIGQLLPHQIQTNNFNTREYIYPVGFRTSRFYWSMRELYKRCRYISYIQDNDGKPEFVIRATEPGYEDLTFKDSNPKDVWMHVFRPIEKMKRKNDLVKLYPSFVTGEEMFGLTDINIVKVLESLPGTDLLKDYSFKFGRSPLIEMPLAINPTGAARTEPKLRTHFRRPHALQTSSSSRSLPSTVTGVTGDINSPYMKQFVHSKSQQYRRLKTEWRINVYLDRSRIQGLGLFAAKDLEKHTMVIEYIGDQIRNEVANRREKFYEEQNRGIYMFRIDDDYVIDATMAGGPARYINHSCAPNCVAEVVPFEKDSKIIIITNRRLGKGEELTYDYKFDFEDDQHKIPCSCGAGCCRKWMN